MPRPNQSRAAVLQVLTGGAASPHDIGQATGLSRSTVTQVLRALLAEGQVAREHDGGYRLTAPAAPQAAAPQAAAPQAAAPQAAAPQAAAPQAAPAPAAEDDGRRAWWRNWACPTFSIVRVPPRPVDFPLEDEPAFRNVLATLFKRSASESNAARIAGRMCLAIGITEVDVAGRLVYEATGGDLGAAFAVFSFGGFNHNTHKFRLPAFLKNAGVPHSEVVDFVADLVSVSRAEAEHMVRES